MEINMELTHLKYFIKVAEELHFGRAAEKLHITQPPLSRHIKRLEDELEVKLFNRTSRRVELSVAGRIFLSEARAIIDHANETCMTMKNFGKGQSGYLPIAFSSSAIDTFLPDAITEFINKFPQVQLSLMELGIVEQFKAFDEKRIHLGFMRPIGYDTSAYSKRLIFSQKYVLALPTNHRLCANSSIKLNMVNNEPLILFPRSRHPQLRDRFDDCFKIAGLKPNIIQELISKHTTLALVKTGIGLAFVPESSMLYSPAGVEFRKLDENLPNIEIFAIWHPENDSPLIKNFLNLINTPMSHF
jgi:DNA-binding transcriptional LysR family regulator